MSVFLNLTKRTCDLAVCAGLQFSRGSFLQLNTSMMSGSQQTVNRLDHWNERWEQGLTGFHKPEVHPMLLAHFDKLFPNGTANKVFLPLCGKSVDINWLSEKNLPVVGLDGACKAIETYLSDFSLEYVKEDVSGMKDGAKLYRTKDDKVRLYCADVMDFNENIEGTFDAIWDRGSLVAINREDVNGYINIMKRLLKPGGRCLLETMDYDVSIMDGLEGPTRPPPPYPMYEAELKSLYEPECTVEYLDRQERKLAGKDIHILMWLITKKSC